MESLKELFARIRRIEITTSRFVEELMQGAYRSAFKGYGLEFEEVRPYQVGDDIRSVDWNVTARTGHPYVKVYQEEREATLFLLVDLSASSRYGTGERTKKEVIAEVAAVMAFSAIKNHDKVGAILFTSKVEKYIPPGRGTRHVLRVVRDLLEFEPEERGTNIGMALEYMSRIQKKPAICFLISDFITQRSYEKEIKMVAKRHDLIALSVNDASENTMPDLGLVAVEDLETGEKKMVDFSDAEVQRSFKIQVNKRKSEVKTLMGKVQAGYIPIQSDEPYEAEFRKYFKTRLVRQ